MPDIFTKLPPEIAGALMAMIMALLRILFDEQEKRVLRITLEALICGALTFSVAFAIRALGLNSDWSIAVGGCIGYLGPLTVRAIAVKYIKSRMTK